jgi:biotin carboxylase
MTEQLATRDRRPVLGIVHGERSVSAMKLAAAAVSDVVWIVDSSALDDPLLTRLLRKLGPTVDVAGLSDDEAAQALAPSGLDGIVTYADHLMPLTSSLAVRLGLDYHDAVVTRRLMDKPTQRQALADGGLPVPRFVLVPSHPTPDDVQRLAEGVDFPVVLKPRQGTGSRETFLVRDPAQLHRLLVDDPAGCEGPDAAMVIEEYLVGATPPFSPHFADYLSVESVVSAGHTSHLAVTGRLPPAEPFRETGLFIPSDLPVSETAGVLDVATKAISALGIGVGFLHTEIKMTARGPQVIEVNGRLGGSIPDILSIAAGIDLFELSQRVALGAPVVFDNLVPTHAVGYLLCPHAPQWARRVKSVDGLDRLGAYPNVRTVFLNRQPGDDIDWRKGSHEYVYSVIGGAPDHEGLRRVLRFVDDEVAVTYAPCGADGSPP